MLTSLVLGGLHQRSGVALPTGGRADPAVGNEALALLILVLVFIVLVSPPQQVRTAADTASEDYSCGHRRCWTAAASKGLLSLVCVVVVLVAMRFASYTLAFDGHVGRSRVLIHTTKVTDVLSVGCTYLGSRADMRYVRMWYIIRHTKTKIIARVHTCTRHACRLFFWDVSIRNSLRSNK